MNDRTLEDFPAYPPVLDAPLVTRVHELNRDYVDLLIDGYASGRFSKRSIPLPRPVMEGLSLLGRQQRTALAHTSYTLYSLGFDQPTFWRTADSCAEELPALSRYEPCTGQAHGAFCEVALFQAWHSAMSNPLAARVVYGMPDAVAEALRALSPWRMKRVAAQLSHTLMPRWPANPRFWPDLVRFATSGDSRLATAQLLGNQLLAAELERARRWPGASPRAEASASLRG